jgi:hypothetical protein
MPPPPASDDTGNNNNKNDNSKPPTDPKEDPTKLKKTYSIILGPITGIHFLLYSASVILRRIIHKKYVFFFNCHFYSNLILMVPRKMASTVW